MSTTGTNAGGAAKRVLMVVANPAVSTTLGYPVGFWASELTHPYTEFRDAGFEVTIASPRGGKVEFDAWSDPRDASGYSRGDLLSLGWIHTSELMALLEDTPGLDGIEVSQFDAIVVCGGQSPTFTFAEEDVADAYVGQQVMPFRIKDEARKRGANFVTAAAFQPFAVRDGNLITGQQQNSGRRTAELVIEALQA